MQGNILASQMYPAQGSTLSTTIDIGMLAPGSYVLEAATQDSKSTQVFIKQ
jgi:hypothetical protein